MSDVLLILPQMLVDDIEFEAGDHPMPPLGLSYIGAALQAAGHDVSALDMTAEATTLEALAERLEHGQPKVVGISCTTISYGRAIQVARTVKAVIPDTWVIVGGPHVTFTLEETLAEPAFDIVVRHEGEAAMCELVACRLGKGSLPEIAGVSFRENGRIVHTPARPYVTDLDALPFPAVSLFPLDRYDVLPISTSRGCPFKCIFCAAGAFAGGHYRVRGPESVVAEVHTLWQKYGRKSFFFVDDTLTGQKQRAKRICDLLEAQCPGIVWRCESRVNTVDATMLACLRRAGCIGVQYGVETGSAQVLSQLDKYITLDQVAHAVELTLRAGIPEVTCSFIMGLPFDTVETVQQTFNYARQLKQLATAIGHGAVIINLTVLVPFPGTAVYQKADELGLQLLTRDWASYSDNDILIETPHLSRRALRQLLFEYQTTIEMPGLLGKRSESAPGRQM
jgi:radical SAM superfamily enzyme YgiQ (UPF0313 family)